MTEKLPFTGEQQEEALKFKKLINEEIENAEEKIMNEFERSGNTWFNCYATVTQVIYGYLETMHLTGIIADQAYEVINNNKEQLKQMIENQQRLISEASELPNEDVRQKFTDYLKNFRQK